MESQRVGPDWTTFTFNVLQCCVGFCLTTMWISHNYIYCCCCSVAQYCVTLCNFMDCSIPGLPVPHHLPEFAQVFVHCIGDVIQLSHPLMPSSPSALDLSQHQRFSSEFLSTSDDHNTGDSASASALPVNIQGWSPLKLTGLISLLSKGLSKVLSSTPTVERHQFFDVLPSLWSKYYNHTWSLGRQ